MLNFIVDYKEAQGKDMHNSIQAIASNKWIAFARITRELFLQGCTPMSIIRIPGNYTYEQLEVLAESSTLITHEVMFAHPDLVHAALNCK